MENFIHVGVLKLMKNRKFTIVMSVVIIIAVTIIFGFILAICKKEVGWIAPIISVLSITPSTYIGANVFQKKIKQGESNEQG